MKKKRKTKRNKTKETKLKKIKKNTIIYTRIYLPGNGVKNFLLSWLSKWVGKNPEARKLLFLANQGIELRESKDSSGK